MSNKKASRDTFHEVKNTIYTPCQLKVSKLIIEEESKEYEACNYELNSLKVIYRTAKITPKKIGQFVTFWKRKENGPIEPFHEEDPINFYVINVRKENHFGQFVIPKSVLIRRGIISTFSKEGKRGFRVYPPWDRAESKQAIKTQKWQVDFFLKISDSTDLERARELYKK